MSPLDYKLQRLNRNEARKRIAQILKEWPENVFFTGHALKELQKDGLTTVDALNVLKSGASKINDEGELHKSGSYTYRLETNNLMVVVAFHPDGEGLNIVTGWDKRKKGK